MGLVAAGEAAPHSGRAHMPVIDPPPEIQAANGTG